MEEQWDKVFTRKAKYSDILEDLKKEFTQRWEEQKPSPYGGLEDYDQLTVIGSGSFGTVKLCRNKKTEKYYAIKILVKENIVKQQQIKHIHLEKRVLYSIKFPFVVNLEFSLKDNDCLYLGLPFVNGGEMFAYHRKVRKFPEKQAKFYAAQVFLALEYLHALDLVYRDLKPENVLIDIKGYIKLTDFGFCKSINGRTWTLCGTPEYLAPEIIQTKAYGKSVDWWAFGIFVYEMVAGVSPFYTPNEDPLVMFSKIIECKYKIPTHFSVDLKHLIQNLLQTDTSRRFGNLKNGPKDIKNHNWFKSTDWIGLLNREGEAPYVPRVKDITDTSNFDKYPSAPIPKSKANKYVHYFEEF